MSFLDNIVQALRAKSDAAPAASESNFKIKSLPSEIKFNKAISVGPYLSDITTLETNINGTDYYYIPQDYLTKGVTGTGSYHGTPQTYFIPLALSNTFQNELKNNGTYVDLSNVPNSYGGTIGDYLGALGRSNTGYLVPKNKVTQNVVENWQITDLGPNGESGIRGIIQVPGDARGEQGLAYATTNSQGYDLGYTDSTGHSYLYSFAKPSSFQKFVADLGPLPTIATAIFAPEFLPLVSGAQTAIQGGDVGDVLKSAAKGYALSELTPDFAGVEDAAAAAETPVFSDVMEIPTDQLMADYSAAAAAAPVIEASAIPEAPAAPETSASSEAPASTTPQPSPSIFSEVMEVPTEQLLSEYENAALPPVEDLSTLSNATTSVIPGAGDVLAGAALGGLAGAAASTLLPPDIPEMPTYSASKKNPDFSKKFADPVKWSDAPDWDFQFSDSANPYWMQSKFGQSSGTMLFDPSQIYNSALLQNLRANSNSSSAQNAGFTLFGSTK